MPGPLAGKVCIVTGASRGLGKGIALQLGDAGAIVYITGRTLSSSTNDDGVGGSILETAEEIAHCGGRCIPVQCDHSNDEDVKNFFARVQTEQNGRLDILVNNAYSAVPALTASMESQLKFWEEDLSMWDSVNRVGLRGHYIASVYATRMMIPAKQGLIINISSAGGLIHFFSVPYSIGKSGVDRMASECAISLRKHNIAFISLWPGVCKTEQVLKLHARNGLNFPGDEGSAQMLAKLVDIGETPEFVGKVVVHLATDSNIMRKSGKIVHTTWVADEFGLVDIDGRHHMNPFSLKWILTLTEHMWLAWIMPEFIKIPKWMVAIMFHKF